MLHLLHFSDSKGAGVDSRCHFPTSRSESAAKGELRDGFRTICAGRRRLLGKEASRMIVLEKTLVAVMPQANECRSQICEFPISFDSTRWKRKTPLRIVRLELGLSMRASRSPIYSWVVVFQVLQGT